MRGFACRTPIATAFGGNGNRLQLSRHHQEKYPTQDGALFLVTLSHSLYKVIVAEIIRWNELLKGMTLGGNQLELAN